jgi:glycosyltransferase involved in cell wall biosynthesis
VTRLHGYLPHREITKLLQSADLLFLPMHDLPDGVRSGLIPGKTYEYLAAGPPILGAVPHGDARDLLLEAGNALICSPRDVAAMAELIEGEVARWREGRRTPPPRPDVVARYDRRRQTGDLAGVLDAVIAARRARFPDHGDTLLSER